MTFKYDLWPCPFQTHTPSWPWPITLTVTSSIWDVTLCWLWPIPLTYDLVYYRCWIHCWPHWSVNYRTTMWMVGKLRPGSSRVGSYDPSPEYLSSSTSRCLPDPARKRGRRSFQTNWIFGKIEIVNRKSYSKLRVIQIQLDLKNNFVIQIQLDLKK